MSLLIEVEKGDLKIKWLKFAYFQVLLSISNTLSLSNMEPIFIQVLQMANRGREARITAEKFINAVKKKRTLSESVLSESLGCNRLTIYRFKIKHPDVFKEMEEYLKQYENINFSGNVTFDIFQNLSEIKEWIEIMKQRQTSLLYAKKSVRALYNVCNYLHISPIKLNVEIVSQLINEMKQLQRDKKDVPSGLSYTTTRSAIRSFFTTVLGISGELLSAKGVDMAATERSGEFSKERVTREQREMLSTTLNRAIMEYNIDESVYPFFYDELLSLCKFCYYTGTRKMAAITVDLANTKNNYTNKIWTINIIDKGKKGGHKWEKILTEFALIDFREYTKKRFNITDDTLEIEIRKVGFAFPSVMKREKLYRDVSTIIGLALHYAGKDTEIPTHIWRHTFAQDGLDATGHNYELVASLGGWDSTTILKKHYGNMSDNAKLKGLRQMMGIKVEEEKPQPLRW
jgi:integrase